MSWTRLAFLSLLLASPLSSEAVIEGHPVQSAPWPWLLSLLNADDPEPLTAHTCGASLIAPGWVLTAAHCVSVHSSYDVLAGTQELSDSSGTRYGVAEIIKHPQFVAPGSGPGTGFDNDIALLRLDTPITGITPVQLPGLLFDELPVKTGTHATIRGWGARSFDPQNDKASDYPSSLHESRMPVVSEPDCRSVMGADNITSNMMCTGDLSGSGDSCVGDSGGPMVVPANTGSGYLQISIISWGFGCGKAGTYGVNTRLDRYANWISAQTCTSEQLPARPGLGGLFYRADGSVDFQYGDAGSQDLRYRLYYAPADTMAPIRYLDMGSSRSYEGKIPKNLKLAVAVQSYRGLCNSPFSDIIEVQG